MARACRFYRNLCVALLFVSIFEVILLLICYKFNLGHDIRRTIKGLAKRDKQKRMLKKKSRTCIDKDELSCKEESESLKNITVNENFLLRTVPKYNSQDTNDSFKNNISAHIDEKIGGENCAFEKIDPSLSLSQSLETLEKAVEIPDLDVSLTKNGMSRDSTGKEVSFIEELRETLTY